MVCQRSRCLLTTSFLHFLLTEAALLVAANAPGANEISLPPLQLGAEPCGAVPAKDVWLEYAGERSWYEPSPLLRVVPTSPSY